jgi:GMP synthase - Glutamine amidotransferase domain
MNEKKTIRLAILDLYEGHPNEGMRCIRQLIKEYAAQNGLHIIKDEFDVRQNSAIPDLSYDIYISTGGPGSPLDSIHTRWENLYFDWLRRVEEYNNNPAQYPKKQVLFICHSFQLACRYFRIARVARRRSTAFGVFPVHRLEGGRDEPIFAGLQDPFYAVDSRDYQVIEPDRERVQELGATILAIEKERPHVPLERAIMAIRFNEHMIGTQFHPEADAIGMSMYLQRADKRDTVIENHGYEKWKSMIEQLNDPDKILSTYSHVIPNFLNQAVEAGSGFRVQGV